MAGVATAPEVAPDEEPTIFDGNDRGDLGRRELGPLESFSRDVDSKTSFDGLEAFGPCPLEWAFCPMPFGMGCRVGFVAFVATERPLVRPEAEKEMPLSLSISRQRR